MNMSEDQFERFLQTMSDKSKDHDLLITIKTIVEGNQKSFIEHRENTKSELDKLNRLSSAAHSRIDKLIFNGLLVVIISAIGILIKFLLSGA